MKYKCLASSTWKLAISSLITVLHTGLKVARAKPNHFTGMWDDLADTLDKFLFPQRYLNFLWRIRYDMINN